MYGNLLQVDEDTKPAPESLNGYALYAGEQFCEYYQKQNGVDVTIVRVPFLYGPGEYSTFFFNLVNQCNIQKHVSLPVDQYKPINFLHSGGVAYLINRVITESSLASTTVINLASLNSITYLDLSILLNQYFPVVSFSFDSDLPIFTRPVNVETAKTVYDWVDVHVFEPDLEALIPQLNEKIANEKGITKVKTHPGRKTVIKWLELLLGGFLMQFLTQLTGTLIQFKYVDFRLLFVVLFASVYGLRFGLLAATLASGSVLYSWYQLGFNWALITNNVGNWFPFVVYFSTGLLLGYYHDKQAMEIENEKKQTALIYGKFKFLYDVFNEITTLKDEFREKLVGYRDSFGKIFSITQELDSLEEDSIFIKALSSLQEFLENDSIAIYSIGKNPNFARLEVNSPAMAGKLTTSLNLEKLPALLPHIEKGSIFHNATLMPDYPTYLSPVMDGNKPVALIVIWEAAFEQQTLYYLNLFKVIKGLIQAALVRAALFADANAENIYIPATRILKPDAFEEALKIKMQMKKNKISDHQVFKIGMKDQNFVTFYEAIKDKVRADDLIGASHDGNCYLLFSQANKESVKEILKRFGQLEAQYE